MVNEIKEFVYWWNSQFPIDYWWRQKHSIAFGSLVHRDVSILDIRFEFEEYQVYKDISSSTYNPDSDDWLVEQVNTEEEINEFYEGFNVDDWEPADDGKWQLKKE